MATAQQVRSQSKQGQWSSIFPQEQVTETQSALFVKKLLAVAVSSISYLRALFPENAFGDRCLEDVNLKILRDDSSCPEACRVIQWIRGCFDALEKKYLRSVMIGIYEDPEDPDTVIEQYTFKFAYGDGNGVDIYRNGKRITTASSEKETKKATIRLLRTIVLLSQTLSPLPDDVMMTMKLLYYDDVTPEDYNPPGFKEAENDDFYFKEEPMGIRVGDVSTQYHSIKLRIKTSNHDLQDADECNEQEAIVPDENNNNVEEAIETDDAQSIYKDEAPAKSNDAGDVDEPPLEEKAAEPMAEESSPATSSVKSPANSVKANDQVVEENEEIIAKCSCGVNEDDGLMVLCAVCNTWQHATCYAILKPEDAPEVHYCVDCSKDSDEYECTDKRLTELSDAKKLKTFCLWRRTLVSVLEASRILAPNLSKKLGVPVATATSLLKRLEEEGFVKPGGKSKRFGKLVQKEEITGRGFNKYFKFIEEEESNQDKDDVGSVVKQTSSMSLSANKTNTNNESLKRKSSGFAVSNKNKDLKFEISDSQTSPSQKDFEVRKKRKTSISVEPMCV